MNVLCWVMTKADVEALKSVVEDVGGFSSFAALTYKKRVRVAMKYCSKPGSRTYCTICICSNYYGHTSRKYKHGSIL